MKKRILTLLCFVTCFSGLFAQNGTKNIDLRSVTSGYFRAYGVVGEMRSMPGGEYYTAMNANRSQILKYSYKTGEVVEVLFDVKKARECDFDKFDNYMISNSGHHILVWRDTEYIYRRSYMAKYYHYDVRRNMVSPLTKAEGKQMNPVFSPDGRMCAYVRDCNIWLKKFDYDSESQVTFDGKYNAIKNAMTDWVYEEEFKVTNLMTWSADSKYLAFVRTDESDLNMYKMQIYGRTLYPGTYDYKYPKAGDKNSKVSLHTYSVETKKVMKVDLPIDEETYIPRIKFTKNPEELAVMTLNRHQNNFKMFYVNPKSSVARLILNEENKYYIDSDHLFTVQFLKDGFAYVSERDGYAHIYRFDSKGTLRKKITSGAWDVTAFYGIDEQTGNCYYASAEESPLRRSVYKIDAKGRKTKLSEQEGTNSAYFNADYSYYVNYFSNVSTPTVATLYQTKRNKAIRILQDNANLCKRLKEYQFNKKEFITLKTENGTFNASIIKPVNFDPNKKYPVLMTQYSGPNSQEVLDRFGMDWSYYLAANGILVASVDGRGTGARGEEFRKCTYLRMGEKESYDQVAAAHALAELPYVDGSRMAIQGWSFGGYTVLMAMGVGEGTFKVGLAVAPPTDWRFYDTVYTERFMRTPQENPEGYRVTSPINYVDKVQGKLLIVHGTADDNVHIQNTMAYIEAMVQANKQFDMMVYKDRDHGIYGGNTRFHLFTKLSNYLFDNL